MMCSNNCLVFTLTSSVCFLLLLPTCSTKGCGLQLTGKMKSRSVVLTHVDMMLCKTVLTKSCGSKVCNETSQCLDKGCKLECVVAPTLCDLHTASIAGDLSRVKFILSQGRPNVHCREWIRRTPVMWAAVGGHREVVELLVSKGAQLSLVDSFGMSILHLACLGGDEEVVKYVLSRNLLDINVKGRCGRTAVMLAAENGHKYAVKVLVDKDADVSLVDNKGENILHYACKGGNVQMVEYILSRKMVHIDSLAHSRKTPAMLAGQNGHKEVVEVLVKHGANLALRDSDRNNILHLTCYGGYVDVVKYVLSQDKVDIDGGGWKGRPPVIVAGKEGHKDLVKLFVKHGANLSLKDNSRRNILHHASGGGHLEVVKYIISLNKIDINSRGFERKTPVMEAGHYGHVEVVVFLVTNGANLAIRDSDTNNILHLIAYRGSMDVLKYVLSRHSVDVNQRGWKRRTPVMIAGKQGNKEFVKLFVNHGAELSLADREGNNILLLSLAHVEVVKYILSLGVVNVNAKNKKRQTAAMRARARGQQHVLDLLVSNGAYT